MRKYNFVGPAFAKPARRVRSPRAIMFTVGSIEAANDAGIIELGSLNKEGFFEARASFLPSVGKAERDEFLYFVP